MAPVYHRGILLNYGFGIYGAGTVAGLFFLGLSSAPVSKCIDTKGPRELRPTSKASTMRPARASLSRDLIICGCRMRFKNFLSNKEPSCPVSWAKRCVICSGISSPRSPKTRGATASSAVAIFRFNCASSRVVV